MTAQNTSSNSDGQHIVCPIPKTHRRLSEAHLLWHQTLNNYQNPTAFRANLNATIEALRNVTFVLQNEKSAFPDFDAWYGPWQARLKADPTAKWLHDARTTVVHQGELESFSTAEVRLVTWKDEVIARLKVEVGASPSVILGDPALHDSLAKYRAQMRDAAIAIERRWSTASLGELELLEGLARVYGLLSDIVLDAHAHLEDCGCIPGNRLHPDFRSAYHRSGMLECMTMGPEKRTRVFKFSTGEELHPAETSLPVSSDNSDLVEAAERYGLDDKDILATWEKLDPVNYAEKILYYAKRMLSRDKRHQRMMFIRDGQGDWQIRVLLARDRTEKHLMMRSVAQFVESKSCDAIIEVGEAWSAPAESVPDLDPAKIQAAKGSAEVLYVVVATREGVFRTYSTPFTRGPLGGIKFGDTDRSSNRSSLFYLEPIFEVWRKQGSVQLADGKELPRIWTPDPLDICFCGGPKRFGECCRTRLPLKPHGRQAIDEAIANGRYDRAEDLARAELAQYVIWIKQHTAITMHVAPELHRELVDIDVLALQFHVDLLDRSLEVNGHAEMFLPQLRHLADIIAVPKFSMRLVALAARWLLRSGRIEEAILEMDALGDIDTIDVTKLEDTMALLTIANICDSSRERKEQLLRRAVDVAAAKEEGWRATFELVEHLSNMARRDEALSLVDSIIQESSSPSRSDELYEALLLRWKITKSRDDLQAFKSAIESSPDVSRPQYAAVFIDEGFYLEAENLLSDEVEKDLVARLLVVDARMRRGDMDSAETLFLTIEQDKIQPEFQYLYAVISAQLALHCKDEKIRKISVFSINNLPASRPNDQYVEDLFLRVKHGGDSQLS